MSLRRTIILLVGVLLLSSCERAVIPESRFADIYHDILLADSYVNGSTLIQATDSIVVYQDIIEKHGWTLAQFNSAQQFYLAHPETFAKLMKKLQKQLTQEKKELEMARDQRLAESDSESELDLKSESESELKSELDSNSDSDSLVLERPHRNDSVAVDNVIELQ